MKSLLVLDKKRGEFIFLLCVVTLLPEAVVPKPVVSSETSSFNKNVEDYLTQFGYLPKASASSMRTHYQLESAVKNLQFFAGLNITGSIDEATANLMTK